MKCLHEALLGQKVETYARIEERGAPGGAAKVSGKIFAVSASQNGTVYVVVVTDDGLIIQTAVTNCKAIP
jgi:hypothetical protein